MQRARFNQLGDIAMAADANSRDRDAVVAAIRAVTQLEAWCAAKKVAYAQALRDMGAPAEVVIAQTCRSNSRDAERVVQRALTAQAAPSFADALANGRVAAGHLDQLSGTLRRLDDGQKKRLLADTPRLLAVAANSTPDEFARTLRTEERRLTIDGGMSRLERQRAAVRLQMRTDLDTGMNIFTLTVDPVTGVKLHNKITAATEALFHYKTPDGCPTDALDKQSFLRAHALLNIIESKGIRLSKPEIVVVVDTTEPDPATGGPTVEWGLPVEIPHQMLVDLFNGDGDVHTIVVRSGVVVHAPGELNLGRTTRLANRAQRRALRSMYSTCAIPGCCARFDLCKIHHVKWWRRYGRTDLCNLLPLCVKHHTLVHTGGWDIHLAPDRSLTITTADGTNMANAPPKRGAA